MLELTRTQCADWLLERDHFVILTHRKPDGDTLGSSAALCRGLRSLGKTAHILESNEITPLFAPLVEGLTKPEPEEGDLLIAVDVAADNMLPRCFAHLRNAIDLRIDHHGSGREYCPAEFVDGEAAACAELIWELLLDMGVEPDEKMAEAVYVGVSTDTGCFRFANTNTHTFDVAADCAATGADIFGWTLKIFETNSLAKLRLQAWVVEHFKLLCDGKVAICALPRSVEEELGVDDDDMSNVSGFLRSIEGVCVAALLRNADELNTKVSVRSIPGYNAASLCEEFGGGGHPGAAGCSIREPLEEAAVTLENALIAWWNK
ncbi:MAG: DHH family phosphoesterase [Oscillospiraceae bacterium]|nr:DHH family phosphoesterase [Oscillospiraceae bacterium]